MEQWIRYRGKHYTLREIDEIREILIAHRDRSRRFISQEICRRWGWRQPNGVLKDMICRGLLLRLEAQGFIELPPRKKNPLNPLSSHQKPQIVEVDQTPRVGKLSDLRPIELVVVRRTPLEKLYRSLIEEPHYLGYCRPVGEHLEYLAISQGQPMACLVLGGNCTRAWWSAPAKEARPDYRSFPMDFSLRFKGRCDVIRSCGEFEPD